MSSQNPRLQVLKAWEAIERSIYFKRPADAKYTHFEKGWVEENLKKKKKDEVIIHTCYLFSIPVKAFIKEFNDALNGQNPCKKDYEEVYDKTFAGVFRIYEDGCPIADTFKPCPIFEELRKITLRKEPELKSILVSVKAWYDRLFTAETETVKIYPDKTKSASFEFKKTKHPLSPINSSDFKNYIKDTKFDVFFKEESPTLFSLSTKPHPWQKLTKATVKNTSFMDSFFLDDLKLARTQIQEETHGEALNTFLQETSCPDRIDWIKEPTKMLDACSPEFIPAGRWPSSPQNSLYLAQQAAINTSIKTLSGKEGIMAISGPPGTGKTTLLKDIIADIVVQRARRLAKLDRPEDLFQVDWNCKNQTIYYLKEAFASCEEAIIVASSNNGAVENISKKLPSKQAIDEKTFQADYFSAVAQNTYANDQTEYWGTISAVLGNTTNCNKFRENFWEEGLKKELEKSPSDKDPSFLEARADFKQALEEYETYITSLKELKTLLTTIRSAEQKINEINEKIREIDATLIEQENSLIETIDALKKNGLKLESCMRRAQSRKPLIWLILIHPFKFFVRRCQFKQIKAKQALLESERTTLESEKRSIERSIERNNKKEGKRIAERKTIEQNLQSLKERQSELKEGLNSVEIPSDFSTKGITKQHLSHPWTSPTLNKKRSLLFLKALALHKAIILHNRKEFHYNLEIIMKIISGSQGFANKNPTEADYKHAWATLFFVIPVISTTFASFGKLFKHLTSPSLGWLMIDEAAQSIPQQAIGALCRIKRVIVIGDRMQTEPIPSTPEEVSDTWLNVHQVPLETFSPYTNSIQTIADRHSNIGTLIEQKSENIWTGMPLRVHRRCADPMFTLSNKMAYDSQMVLGRSAEPARASLLGEVCWFNVVDETPIDDGHAYAEEISLLKELLKKLLGPLPPKKKQESFEAFVITPFTSITTAVHNRLTTLSPSIRSRVKYGTIHKFQGEEANFVFLLLGGDTRKRKALDWVGEKPNLLNTAVTRAKEYLYIIGNHDRWVKKKIGCFEHLQNLRVVDATPRVKALV